MASAREKHKNYKLMSVDLKGIVFVNYKHGLVLKHVY